MMMKILIATAFNLPGGGIWSFVSNLEKSLKKFGHRVDILCYDQQSSKMIILNENKSEDLSAYCPYVEKQMNLSCPGLERHPWIYSAEKNRYLLEKGLSHLNLSMYDIIHAQDVISAVAINRIKNPATPLITSVHGFLSGAVYHQLHTSSTTDSHQLWNTFLLQYYSRIEKIGYQSSDFIHTSSNWMREIIEKEFQIPSYKINTFHYGVDLSDFVNGQGQNRNRDKKIILSIARLVYLKGLDYLIDALSLLKKDQDDWECWILGEGALEHSLKTKVKKLGLEDKVIFWGKTSKVKSILLQAEMLVLPSLQENQPFAVIESQLMGVPTIVSNAGGLPEIVEDGKNGYVVPKENSHELYRKIQYLLSNPNVREQMSQYGMLQGRRNWNINRTRKNMIELYSSALRAKSGINKQ
jgi:glycosyltransferase involved in cell wall biosynthesis